MKILMLSHTYYGGVYKVGSHHLVDNFRAKNHDVIYVSTPLSVFHIFKLYDVAVRERFKVLLSNVFLKKKAQIIPFTLFPISSDFFYRGLFKKKAFFIKELMKNDFDLILIDQPLLGFVLDSDVSGKVIYRPTDIYEEMISNKSRVALCEKNILSKSSGMIATSRGVLEFLKSKYSKYLNENNTLVVENGVDLQHFRQKTVLPKEYKELDKYKVVYVGALDERFAIEDVLFAAKELSESHFFLIGNGCVYDEYKNLKLDNVTFLGTRDYKEVPAYLQYADCTLLPMKKSPANESRSPMKYYEYLAVGKPFICSWNRYLVERQDHGVLFYKQKKELVKYLKAQEASEKNENRVISLQEVDWSKKAEAVLEFSMKC